MNALYFLVRNYHVILMFNWLVVHVLYIKEVNFRTNDDLFIYIYPNTYIIEISNRSRKYVIFKKNHCHI